jgi:hypothetical protein
MKFFNILLIFCALVFLSSEPSQALSTKFTNNVAELNIKNDDGKIIKVNVIAQNYSSAFPYKEAIRWGHELKKPKTIITSIDVLLGSKKLFVPLSAYSDLSNPKKVSLEISKYGFHILIAGGSASTFYNAELIFKNGFIHRRIVRHGEFPEVAWEETVYSFNPYGK